MGTSPAATATALPLDEPPGACGHCMPGIVRRAMIVIDPGGTIGELHRVSLAEENHSRRQRVCERPWQSCPAMLFASRCVPAVVGTPFTSNRSFAAYGMPCRTPKFAPPFNAISAARACARACSGMTLINACSRSSSASIRPRSSSAIFTGLSRPLPMRPDRLAIDSNASAVSDMMILGIGTEPYHAPPEILKAQGKWRPRVTAVPLFLQLRVDRVMQVIEPERDIHERAIDEESRHAAYATAFARIHVLVDPLPVNLV